MEARSRVESAATMGRKHEIETLVHTSPYQHDVPAVPDTPVCQWGTLAWARLALALIAEVGRLRTALAFYADADHYFETYQDETDCPVICAALEDDGSRAREALNG